MNYITLINYCTEIAILVALIIIAIGVWRINRTELHKKEYTINHYRNYYNLLILWIHRLNNQWDINQYFIHHNQTRILIYGYGEICKRLLEELDKKQVQVIAIVDKYITDKIIENNEFPLIAIDMLRDFQNKADAIVVTPISYFDSIKEEIINFCPNLSIISLKEIMED